MTSPGRAVEIAHLRKTYGPVTAVDDVSFPVAGGEIFGILGPNGAGKTTTVGRVRLPRAALLPLGVARRRLPQSAAVAAGRERCISTRVP